MNLQVWLEFQLFKKILPLDGQHMVLSYKQHECSKFIFTKETSVT